MKRIIVLAAILSGVAPAAAGEARPFGDGSWKVLLATHAGHPTIVHFWGLTCSPCRLEMANWGKLLGSRHDVDFVTIDTDTVPATASDQAAAFLATSGVGSAEAWHFADAFAEKLYFQVDPQWQGEIPMTILIGRDGHSQRIVGAVEPTTITTWLAQQGLRP